MSLEEGLQRVWYGSRWLSLPLRPLAWLFHAAVSVRRGLYRRGILPVHRAGVPVVVVGNVTVGGTGKTPVAAWLARQLTLRGHRVGVVLRGYGGRSRAEAVLVKEDSDPDEVGDEAVLHAGRRPHVVVVGADRVAAARRAAEQGAQVVVCDDGLQHLRLARDFEIAVVDGERGLGNGLLLPAGPLREPRRRLESVDEVVLTVRGSGAPRESVAEASRVAVARLTLGAAVNLVSGEHRALEAFRGTQVHAVAGIGHPEAFFGALRAAGLDVAAHALPDHAPLDPLGLPFPEGSRVLMTEKDAVKCRKFAGTDWWYVRLEVELEHEASRSLLARVLESTGAGDNLG